jgi:hypothetical protein
MAQSDDFKAQLLRRIARYRDAEGRVRQRSDEIRSELETTESRRNAAERLYEAEFGDLPDIIPAADRVLTESKAPTREGPLTGVSWASAITAVLGEHGPLHVKEIWRNLQDEGFRTNAQDPLRSIVAVSIREPKINRVGANRYGLSKVPADEGRLV